MEEMEAHFQMFLKKLGEDDTPGVDQARELIKKAFMAGAGASFLQINTYSQVFKDDDRRLIERLGDMEKGLNGYYPIDAWLDESV